MSKNRTKIHIHAKCGAFEIFELRSERHVAARLKKIMQMFQWAESHSGSKVVGKLTVKTGVHNPTIPFL